LNCFLPTPSFREVASVPEVEWKTAVRERKEREEIKDNEAERQMGKGGNIGRLNSTEAAARRQMISQCAT